MHKEIIFSPLGLEESYIVQLYNQNGKNASKINNGLGQLCKDRSSQSLALGTASYLKINFFLFHPHPPSSFQQELFTEGCSNPSFLLADSQKSWSMEAFLFCFPL